jgi:hypothetical protein
MHRSQSAGRFPLLGRWDMTVIRFTKASRACWTSIRARALSLSSKFGAALRALHYTSVVVAVVVVVGHARKDKATTANQQ